MEIDKQFFAKQLGSNIAKYRQNSQLTQEQLAEKLDIGNEAISRIERGVAMPSLMRLVEFANVFQCSVADLLQKNNSTSKDEIAYLDHLLNGLDKSDRAFIITLVEKTAEHLKSKDYR